MCRHYTGSKSTHRHVYVSTTTADRFRCVQMPERSGFNEPRRVAGLRQRWGSKRLGSQSVSAAGRAQERSSSIQSKHSNPIPERTVSALAERLCPTSKRLTVIAQFNLACYFQWETIIWLTLRVADGARPLLSFACLPSSAYEWGSPSAKWAIPKVGVNSTQQTVRALGAAGNQEIRCSATTLATVGRRRHHVLAYGMIIS